VLELAGAASPRLEPVAGDASSRRYFRLIAGGRAYIVVDSPPATEKNQAFLDVRDQLAAGGVRVPQLHGVDLDRGYLVLEDFGDRLMLDALNPASVEGHYQAAFRVLLRMAGIEADLVNLPAYDEALLTEELGRFPQWFAAELLACPMAGEGEALFNNLCRLLLDSALEQPRVVVHRDFHSRNLMLLPGDELGVIDFQDAALGPVTYDLASLLRDCYIRWPEQQVTQWALDYRLKLVAGGLQVDVDEQPFLRWFDWMGLQRHLKVLGTFARLYLRDGKSAYLSDLPLVIAYTGQILDKYAASEPDFAAFGQWFREELGPPIAGQAWSEA
jgi:aminoglycoside/choline kinase family phosphotransferase